MGTWGTGIYSDDTASDVKEICQEIFPFVSVDEGNEIIFQEYRELINSSAKDNDYASFWYALADWQWNHGILTDSVKEHTLELLYNYTGISDWEQSGSKSDVGKRKNVLDKLRKKLESSQPPVKLPKACLEKPKYKYGDVIIFQMDASQKGFEHSWQIEYTRPAYIYDSDRIRESITEKFNPPKDYSGNYCAIICVGTIKEPYSEHINGVYNERSVYAMYNYCKQELPTLEKLSKCGFLPRVRWVGDPSIGPNHGKTVSIEWVYKFILICENLKKEHSVGEFYILHSDCEADRFKKILSIKQYSNSYDCDTCLSCSFSGCNEERLRLEQIGITIDDLIQNNVKNPALRSPDEIDRIQGVGKYSE